MVKKILFLFLITGFNVVSSAQINSAFSKEQLSSDVAFLVTTIEHVHPNPFHTITKENFYKLKDSVIKSFTNGMTLQRAWPGFARIVAALDEGHSNLNPPASFQQDIQSGKIKVFPILLKEYNEKGLVVRYDLSSNPVLIMGDIITAINHKTARELMNYFTSFYGGLSNWRNLLVVRDIGGNLSIHGFNAPYHVEYFHNGIKKEITVDGSFFPQMLARLPALQKTTAAASVKKDYSFERLEHNIGYLDFHSMNNLAVFQKFLDSVFTDIKNKPVSGLIIDLRQNGGGNSELGERLLSYITDKPFRMSGGSNWKVSEEYKTLIREQAPKNTVYASGSFQQYIKYETGKLISSTAGKPVKAGNDPLRYSGKLCVLIGPNTFSSTNMLSNAIKDFKLATLIGEPTGEPANDYGELYWNKLPNTQLNFSTCSKQFIRANGDSHDPNPILPDITVKQNPSSSKDDVLEFAKGWMGK